MLTISSRVLQIVADFNKRFIEFQPKCNCWFQDRAVQTCWIWASSLLLLCKVEFEAVQEWLFVVCRLNSKDAKLESSHVEKLGEVRNSCRFECTLWKVLQFLNEYLVTRIGCNTAENEPYKIWQNWQIRQTWSCLMYSSFVLLKSPNWPREGKKEKNGA